MSQLIGNPTAKHCLQAMIQKQRVPAVLLFHGISGIGKKEFAFALALYLLDTLNRSHPDLHFYTPAGTAHQHTMESMHELLHEAGLKPFSAACKIFIIDEAERMLSSSSNALLKTLEEPPSQVYIILLSSEPAKLPPTIISRTRQLQFFPIAEPELASFLIHQHGLTAADAQKYAILSEGSLSKAIDLATKSITLPIPALMQISSHTELLTILSQLQEPADEDKNRYANRIFEEILFWIRQHNPLQLETALKLIAKSNIAIQQHVKLKQVVEHLCMQLKNILSTELPCS